SYEARPKFSSSTSAAPPSSPARRTPTRSSGPRSRTCVPTLPLRVQQNGTFQGWQTLVGGQFGYDCVDDSDGTTHDSGATYVLLPKMIASTGAGIASFPLFLGVAGATPSSIQINVVAQRNAASHPRMQIGLYRAGVTLLDGTFFDPPASWALATRTFS